jgi:hypothetical protein
MGYFTSCQNIEEVRNLYFQLAKKHHPDLGGNLGTMQTINAEYDQVCKMFGRKTNPGKDSTYYAKQATVDVLLREILSKLVKIQGIKIEVCGLWVWVSGDTRPHKDELKALGLYWASKKGMWYFAGIPSHSHRPIEMTTIRKKYGSKLITERDL